MARRHGVDLRQTGDGNPGAWNALEQLGWRRAWPAFAADGAKGLIAAVLGWLAVGSAPFPFGGGTGLAPFQIEGDPSTWVVWACVGAAMLGHAVPLRAPRSGGMSVMTFAGGGIGLVPLAALPLAVLAAAFALGRRAGLGARLAVFGFPFAQAAVTPLVQVGWTGILMTFIGLLFFLRRHRRRRAG